MRERLARISAALITAVLVATAAFFAGRRNADPGRGVAPADMAEGPAGVAASPLDPALVARGRAVYEDQACSRCHSVEGRGNPRAPLDGVGARLTPEALRDWVTAASGVRGSLSRSAQRAKDAFKRLPEADLDALVTYLASLR